MNDVHSCSYYCGLPECIKAQRDELVRRFIENPEIERALQSLAHQAQQLDMGYDHEA